MSYLHQSFAWAGISLYVSRTPVPQNCGVGVQNPLHLFLFLTDCVWRPDLNSFPHNTWCEVISRVIVGFPLTSWGNHCSPKMKAFVIPTLIQYVSQPFSEPNGLELLWMVCLLTEHPAKQKHWTVHQFAVVLLRPLNNLGPKHWEVRWSQQIPQLQFHWNQHSTRKVWHPCQWPWLRLLWQEMSRESSSPAVPWLISSVIHQFTAVPQLAQILSYYEFLFRQNYGQYLLLSSELDLHGLAQKPIFLPDGPEVLQTGWSYWCYAMGVAHIGCDLIQLNCHVAPTHPIALHPMIQALPSATHTVTAEAHDVATLCTEIHPPDSASHHAVFKSAGAKSPPPGPVISILLTSDNNHILSKSASQNIQMSKSTTNTVLNGQYSIGIG